MSQTLEDSTWGKKVQMASEAHGEGEQAGRDYHTGGSGLTLKAQAIPTFGGTGSTNGI